MPARANKICGHHAGCIEVVPHGQRYCETHQREHAWQGAGSPRTGTTEHKARRARVLKRDRYRCQLRYPGVCIVRAREMDHIVPVTEGGTDDLSNLQSACGPCHQRKASMEGHAAHGHRIATLPAPRTPTPPPTARALPRRLW